MEQRIQNMGLSDKNSLRCYSCYFWIMGNGYEKSVYGRIRERRNTGSKSFGSEQESLISTIPVFEPLDHPDKQHY